MIASFKDREAEKLFDGAHRRKYSAIEKAAERKLRSLHRASALNDFNNPPGNRLEALKGDRVGQRSIRINDQYRICFRWESNHVHEVEIVEYH